MSASSSTTNTIFTAPVSEQAHQAATTIQACFRGHRVRKNLISRELYPLYAKICHDPKLRSREYGFYAEKGKTAVFFPNGIPEIIIKGSSTSLERFHVMQETRAVLNSLDSSHLVIPKARICNNLLVEERLPINNDSHYNMAIYLSEPSLFDDAVIEMTKLFSQLHLSDIVGYLHNVLGNLEDNENNIRYDNIPLIVSEKNGVRTGMVGLIDLERIKPTTNYLTALISLAQIFPYHLELIKTEAKKISSLDDTALQTLDAYAHQADLFFRRGYSDHLSWLQAKGISLDTVQNYEIHVSDERKQELIAVITNGLLQVNQGINTYFKQRKFLGLPVRNFLQGNPEESAKLLAPQMTEAFLNKLKECVKIAVQKISPNHDSPAMLVRSCALEFHRNKELYSGVSRLLRRPLVDVSFIYLEDIFNELGRILFTAMSGHEIYQFNSGHRTDGHEKCWVCI